MAVAAVPDVVDRAEAERQWPVTVTLAHPIEFGKGELITSLEFRRGRLGDLKGVTFGSFPPVEQLMLIASRMCGKPVGVIERLDEEDSPEVLAIALGFYARCQGAGPTP